MILGKTIRVVSATNPGLVGLEGTVVADRPHTLRIDTPRGEKVLVKHTITLMTEGFIIEGKTLEGDLASRHQ